MNFMLMHKNDEVAKLDIDSNNKLKKILINQANKHLVPIGGQMNLVKMYEWWEDRAIPKTRDNCKKALDKLGYASTMHMLVDNFALSLNDCYWIKPIEKDITWEEVSPFSNTFIDVFGDYTFNSCLENTNETEFVSIACQGNVKKKWMIDNSEKIVMVKGNHEESYQQSINEVFTSLLHSYQGKIPYVNYNFIDITITGTLGEKSSLGCVCDNFCSENVESISVWEALQSIKNRPSDSWHIKTKKALVDNLGMELDHFQSYLDYVIMTDFLISNTDRHLNNLAIVRDSNTLQLLGFSPIYDYGNSMFFKQTNMPIHGLKDIKTHSFLDKEINLLKLVNNRDIVDLSKLPTQQEFESLYSRNIESEHYKIPHLYNAFMMKCYMLNEFQNGKNIWENNKYKR